MYLSLQWLLPKTNNENRFSQMSDIEMTVE